MMSETSVDLATSQAPESIPTHLSAPTAVACYLVGGKRIVREALGQLLDRRGLAVAGAFADHQQLAEHIGHQHHWPNHALIQILSAASPFVTLRQIRETLVKTGQSLPLVVLAEQVTRGQVYAALRVGAKAYVNLDAEPDEMVRAIRTAAKGRTYLAPDVAELLVSDVSSRIGPAGAARLGQLTLSPREVEVVQLLCEGLSSKQIGRSLHISAKTVENHRYNIYRKCDLDGLAALMRYAIHQGLISI